MARDDRGQIQVSDTPTPKPSVTHLKKTHTHTHTHTPYRDGIRPRRDNHRGHRALPRNHLLRLLLPITVAVTAVAVVVVAGVAGGVAGGLVLGQGEWGAVLCICLWGWDKGE